LTLCSVVYLHLAHITSVVEALSFTVVLVVASIPLAIEIVTTTTLALGSKELSHHGAIVTRLSAIEDMAGMAILCRCAVLGHQCQPRFAPPCIPCPSPPRPVSSVYPSPPPHTQRRTAATRRAR